MKWEPREPRILLDEDFELREKRKARTGKRKGRGLKRKPASESKK